MLLAQQNLVGRRLDGCDSSFEVPACVTQVLDHFVTTLQRAWLEISQTNEICPCSHPNTLNTLEHFFCQVKSVLFI